MVAFVWKPMPPVMLTFYLLGCREECPAGDMVVKDSRSTRSLCIDAPVGKSSTAEGATDSGAWTPTMATNFAESTIATESVGATVSTTGTGAVTESTSILGTEATMEGAAGATETDGTMGERPQCGNGIVEEGEDCDDGNHDSSDACLPHCVKSSCGDGYVWVGVEECDDGDRVSGDGCDLDCSDEYVIFVTSVRYSGKIGSISVADGLCDDEAEAGGLAGAYVAWLSSNQGGWDLDFADSDLPFGKPLIRRDGELIVTKAEDLILAGSTVLLNPINLTANKMEVAGAAWTGTLEHGFPGADCGGWADSSANQVGTVGYLGQLDADWTSAGELKCDEERYFYCFRRKSS